MLLSSRRARAGALVTLLVCTSLVVPFGQASRGAPPTPAAPEGALGELRRAKRDEALIRAENTATLLRILDAAPILPGGGS